MTTPLTGHFPDSDVIISTDFNSNSNQPVVMLRVETFLEVDETIGATVRALLAAGKRRDAFEHLVDSGTIPKSGTSSGHSMLRAAFGVDATGGFSAAASARPAANLVERGHFPDVDFVIRQDTGTNGQTIRSVSIETTVTIKDSDSKAWDDLRAALPNTSDAGLRASYELLYAVAKGDLGEPGLAHAVVQAAFKQIVVDSTKIPK